MLGLTPPRPHIFGRNITQEVEARRRVLPPTVVILAVHQSRLQRMQRQAALSKALGQSCQHGLGLLPRVPTFLTEA